MTTAMPTVVANTAIIGTNIDPVGDSGFDPFIIGLSEIRTIGGAVVATCITGLAEIGTIVLLEWGCLVLECDTILVSV